ncbi:hypothetical protein CLOSTASPAR_02172 [[Clostridium] asparagiforme DSM 15981]|uniref:Uncharacterized protein n=1 Tax=[Clostridium] asparagiforme DSM 15981 TaxID=518636 RepID=C0CYU5_9FIRM|nr:hypothetical protein CLOSTASPAR_02172 [[Clostridium] asparagiforme DSM 15981]
MFVSGGLKKCEGKKRTTACRLLRRPIACNKKQGFPKAPECL